MATNADGARIAWYRYGSGPRQILFVPTWNIVDARVVGHQVVALAPVATVVTYDPRGAGRSDRPDAGYDFPTTPPMRCAVLDANGFEDASAVVTASRGLNVAASACHQAAGARRPNRGDRARTCGSSRSPTRPDPRRTGVVADRLGRVHGALHAERVHRARLGRGDRGDDGHRHGGDAGRWSSPGSSRPIGPRRLARWLRWPARS